MQNYACGISKKSHDSYLVKFTNKLLPLHVSVQVSSPKSVIPYPIVSGFDKASTYMCLLAKMPPSTTSESDNR